MKVLIRLILSDIFLLFKVVGAAVLAVLVVLGPALAMVWFSTVWTLLIYPGYCVIGYIYSLMSRYDDAHLDNDHLR